jgi:hypothetical protein
MKKEVRKKEAKEVKKLRSIDSGRLKLISGGEKIPCNVETPN